jgi:hypothetical protein
VDYRSSYESDVESSGSVLRDVKVHLAGFVVVVEGLNRVAAWEEDPPELAVTRRLESNLAVLDPQRHTLHRQPRLVHHEPLHPSVHFTQKSYQRLCRKNIPLISSLTPS